MAADYPDVGAIEGGDEPRQFMNTSAENVVRGLNSAEVWLIEIVI